MKQTYRTSVWVLFAQALIVFWTITLVRLSYLLLSHEAPPIYNSTLIGGTLGLAAAMTVVAWWYRVEVSKGRIRGPTLWGGFVEIALTPALRFKEIRILGFRYLKIWGAGKGTIWVALPVRNESELRSLLGTQGSPKGRTVR